MAQTFLESNRPRGEVTYEPRGKQARQAANDQQAEADAETHFDREIQIQNGADVVADPAWVNNNVHSVSDNLVGKVVPDDVDASMIAYVVGLHDMWAKAVSCQFLPGEYVKEEDEVQVYTKVVLDHGLVSFCCWVTLAEKRYTGGCCEPKWDLDGYPILVKQDVIRTFAVETADKIKGVMYYVEPVPCIVCGGPCNKMRNMPPNMYLCKTCNTKKGRDLIGRINL